MITRKNGGLSVVMFSDAQPVSGDRYVPAGAPGDPVGAPRGAPLTPVQFRAHRRLAERRGIPLRVVLDAIGRTPARPR